MKLKTTLVLATSIGIGLGCTYPPSQVPEPTKQTEKRSDTIYFQTQIEAQVEEFCYKGFKYALIGGGNGRMAITVYNGGRQPLRCEEEQ